MNIQQYKDTILNCRFCFMCRHLSAISNVTFNEADSPRVRALALYSVLNKSEELSNPDFIRNMYDCDLSKSCTYHCVSSYKETELVLAARRDIVELGHAPEKVKRLAEEFSQNTNWIAEGDGEILYFEDFYSSLAPEIGENFRQLSPVKVKTISGSCIGRALYVLGYAEKARQIAEKFAAFINGLGSEILVVSNPAAYDTLQNLYKEFAIELKVKVQHSSEYLSALNLNYQDSQKTAAYLESDFLKNYNDAYPYPHKLLEQLGVDLKPFGTNNEESYSAGEGAILLPRLNESLTEKLAQRVAKIAAQSEVDMLITASPYTKYVLQKYAGLTAVTLEELAGGYF